MSDQCCCQWGAAIGNRGNGPSGEVPEFPCADCPVPGHDLMASDESRCRRHRRCCCLSEGFRCTDCYVHPNQAIFNERCRTHRQAHLSREKV